MGACCSSQMGSAQSKHDAMVKGPATHDSAWSVDEPNAAAANGTAAAAASGAGAKQQHKSSTAGSAAAAATATKKQGAHKRAVNVDMITGEVIPDMGVHGVFDVLYELGSGGSGRTFLCRDMASGKVVAVKFVPRPLAKSAIPFMMAEVEIQAELGEGCLNLIKMHEILLTKTHLALVLEYASGGSLTQEVSCLWESALQRGGLFMEEQEASYYLRQFVHAIAYCHKHRVVHRDLKLDNTLLEACIVGLPRIKICDFGFAKRWGAAGDQMHTAIGTPVYMSPQMLAARQCKRGYSGVKADMWAVGVLMFVMLLGTFPFDHDENHDPNSAEAANEVWLKQQQQGWRKSPRAADVLKRRVLSAECCDLLDKLLEMDEDKRVTTAEVLDHPWLSIALTPEQQDSWAKLQEEQQALDAQLQAASNPRLAKMRREAMFAMMAISAKPPGPTLIPGPGTLTSAASGSLHGTLTGSTSNRSDTSIAAAAAAATAANSLDGAVAAGQQQQQQYGLPPGSAPGSPFAAALVSAAGSPQMSPRDGAVSPVSPASPAAEGPAAAAAGQQSDAADIAAFAVGDAEAQGAAAGPDMKEDAQHLSFTEGEGLRTASLEYKVEAYRQQAQQIRAARMAAAMGAVAETDTHHSQQQQQQQQHGGVPATRQGSTGSSNSSAAQPGAAAPAGAAAAAAAYPQQGAGLTSRSKGSSADGSTAAAANKQRVGKRLKSPFAAVTNSVLGISKSGSSSSKETPAATAAAAAADAAATAEEEADEDLPDEVWRLPLVSTADPSEFKLMPELSVAAGALIRQLQGSGKVPGRGRSNRSSCPMY